MIEVKIKYIQSMLSFILQFYDTYETCHLFHLDVSCFKVKQISIFHVLFRYVEDSEWIISFSLCVGVTLLACVLL